MRIYEAAIDDGTLTRFYVLWHAAFAADNALVVRDEEVLQYLQHCVASF